MPERRRDRPLARPRVAAPALNVPAGVGRALADVTDAVRRVEAQVQNRATHQVDLVVGDNPIAHGLGRRPIGANVSPTVADETFAWAMTSADDLTATIEVRNIDQPRAGVEFW